MKLEEKKAREYHSECKKKRTQEEKGLRNTQDTPDPHD